MKKKKILYITGTRADFGRATPILRAIRTEKNFKLFIFATGSHLSSHFGQTVEEIKKEFAIAGKLKTGVEEEDTPKKMVQVLGQEILGMAGFMDNLKPDLILVLGDRNEMLAGAVIGSHLNILVGHIGGGQVTGSIDDKIRDAITIFSDIHFVATKKNAERVIKLGACPKNVYVVGAPDLEAIAKKDFTPGEEIYKKFKLNPDKPVILLSQHPVTTEYNKESYQMKMVLEAIKDIPAQIIATYPNEDAGGKTMTNVLKQFVLVHPQISLYKHIVYKDYLGLMAVADLMVGNSSAGIIEAPSFNLAVANIGTRQEGRERAKNVIDVDYNKLEIKKAIEKSLSVKKIRKIKNPYGDGKTAQRIMTILKNKFLYD